MTEEVATWPAQLAPQSSCVAAVSLKADRSAVSEYVIVEKS